jgi:hypothetical protein
MLIRQIHTYLGVFVAPTILFFAFTGCLQLFSLHEAHDGYQPPVLVEKLARLHKDQVFGLGPKHEHQHAEAPPLRVRSDGDWVAPALKPAAEADDSTPPRVLALKVLFLAAAVMLILSTLLGLWMALTQNRRKALLWVLLILGAAAPIALIGLP